MSPPQPLQPLRVGIDYLPAVAMEPGAGRYARELVRALVALEERPELALYEVGRTERTVPEAELGLPPSSSPAGPARLTRLRSTASRRVLRANPFRRWRCADVALGGVDVFHHTWPRIPPVARAAQVVPVSAIPASESREEELLSDALDRAAGVVVFSANAGKRVRDRFGTAAELIHEVPVGSDHWRREVPVLPEREEIPRILVLGALQASRRPMRLLKAFELLIEDVLPAHLHIVGRGGDQEREFDRVVATSKARLWIARSPSLPPREMAALCARSSLLVHLTEDAATPVTPLEAFSFGTPVVASRLPVYEEALGDLAELVLNGRIDHTAEILVEAMARAIQSARDPHACAARMERAGQYTWARNASETVGVWEKVAAERALSSSRR